MTGIIYPNSPLNPRVVDEEFADEKTTARWAGVDVNSLVDHDGLMKNEKEANFRNLTNSDNKLFYRGWMLTEDAYEFLYDSLAFRGLDMVVTPSQYVSAHHLPGWVGIFGGITPASIILSENPTVEEIVKAGNRLAASPFTDSESFVVKDFVKSRKHEWDTACYAADVETLPSVVAEFIRLQEEYLVGGIVIREFVELDKTFPESRLWWVDDELVLNTLHPDVVGTDEVTVMDPDFLDVVKARLAMLGAPFVTTDIARKTNGEFVVIEVGDGQVSGFNKNVTDEQITTLFAALKR
jgi:hypothetical protein